MALGVPPISSPQGGETKSRVLDAATKNLGHMGRILLLPPQLRIAHRDEEQISQ